MSRWTMYEIDGKKNTLIVIDVEKHSIRTEAQQQKYVEKMCKDAIDESKKSKIETWVVENDTLFVMRRCKISKDTLKAILKQMGE